MKTLLILLVAVLSTPVFVKADFFGDGNFNGMFTGNDMTNSMNQLSNSVTFASWLRIRNTGTGLEQKNVFFSKGRLDFTATCNYLLRISSSRFEFNYTDQVGGLHTYRATSTIVWTNVLRFLAMTFTYGGGGSTMQMYIDGLPVSGSWISGNGDSNSLPNAHQFSLSGPTAQNVGGGIIMGEWGPAMAWTTNLTSTQIQALYKARVHGLQYVIEPTKCLMYFDWSQARFGVDMDNGTRAIDRSPLRQKCDKLGNASRGNWTYSFVPNE